VLFVGLLVEKWSSLYLEALRGFPIEAGPFFNEQSDKEHVVILVKLAS
jgi:hypothetical protein